MTGPTQASTPIADMPKGAPVPADAIRPVQGISWPRSGHHLVVRLLQGYFGPAFGYCEFHRAERPSVPGIEKCCKTVPCAYGARGVHFTKNHDFDLDAPQVEGLPYLVQYRDFVPSVVSNFELFIRTGGEDSAEAFRRFASNQFTRYANFTDKWVNSDFISDQIVLHYDDLTAHPEEALAHMVRWFAPDHTPDTARIAQVVRAVDGQKVERAKTTKLAGTGVHASRDVRDFRYYAPQLFDALANLKLRREDVIATFRKVLGRKPGEPNMLRLQCQPDLETLEATLRASPEYLKRQAESSNSGN